MTLHSAKGLEFPLVFLPGWEEGVFPTSARIDETGEKGLEEERRLAYVGITRAREEARISFAANRQVYGRWTSQLPSRFVDELPLANVEAASETGYYGGGPGMQQTASRWDETQHLRRRLHLPGWKRAQEPRASASRPRPAAKAPIEGEGRLVAVSASSAASDLQARRPGLPRQVRLRQDHQRRGQQAHRRFDKAGEKKVIDSFVEKALSRTSASRLLDSVTPANCVQTSDSRCTLRGASRVQRLRWQGASDG
jgi:DNA helicase-2/ATP-dependent DNA helicase PcrA